MEQNIDKNLCDWVHILWLVRRQSPKVHVFLGSNHWKNEIAKKEIISLIFYGFFVP